MNKQNGIEIKVTNIYTELLSFECWFQDEAGNKYYDNMFDGEYQNGDMMMVYFDEVDDLRFISTKILFE